MDPRHQLYEILSNIKLVSNHKYKEVFDQIKSYMSHRIIEFLDKMKRTTRGHKRIIDFNQFLTCLFSISDCGFKMSYIKDIFKLSKSTYYYYFDLLTKNIFFKNIYDEVISSYNNNHSIKYLITDTFTVKSMDGSNGLGRTATDRGRKGLKVSLICDQNLVTYSIHLAPANNHDSKRRFKNFQPKIILVGKIGQIYKNYTVLLGFPLGGKFVTETVRSVDLLYFSGCT